MTAVIFSLNYAEQKIEIVGGSTSGPKIDIANFMNDPQSDTSTVVANDLKLTGEFNVSLMLNGSEQQDVSQYLVTGEVQNSSILCKLASREINGQNTVLFDKNYTYLSESSKRKAIHSSKADETAKP